MNSGSDLPARITFGRFCLMPRQRELLLEGRPVKLGSRAFDVLLALVEAHGSVVSKDALMARVWPGQVVEENNLEVQISMLRAAFGAERGLIRTVSRRGYQFTAEIRLLRAAADEQGENRTPPAPASSLPPTNLPEPVSELIGRENELREILELAAAHRLVTLTGAGGIGKTRLALAAARELRPRFAEGVWLIELSPLTDRGLVPATVAAAVGLETGGGELSAQRLAQALAGRQLLLVLDTCEHVIAAPAALGEAILRAGRGVCLFATSREPLEVEGEWTYQVPPLAVPAEDAAEDELLRSGAVRLFTERARAANVRFRTDGHVGAGIAAICRRLDGIPLAIEMAAGRTSTLSVNEIAARLNDRFHLLTARRRTALPRHQTLRATLEWSYQLLPEEERTVFRSLGVFAGPLSLEAADAVIASAPEAAHWTMVEALASLVAKSLVVVDIRDDSMRYRLLDTTRAYALEKLDESGERASLARRHAEYYLGLLERAEAEWETRPAASWLADYGPQIDDLRGALDWAFSQGDAPIGVALAAAAVPLWMQLSLVEECRSRAEQALAAGAECDPVREMKLQAALGASLIFTRPGVAEIDTAFTRSLELADSLDNSEYRLRSLCGLWVFNIYSGPHRLALEIAERFRALAATRPDPNDRLVGERMVGSSLHFLGDQSSGRRCMERVLDEYVSSNRRSYICRFPHDLVVLACVNLARILWLLGFPDRAVRIAERAVDEARAANHANTLCHALATSACLIARLVGNLDAAERYADTLLDHSRRHGLALWHNFGRIHQALLAIKRGDTARGSQLLRASLTEVGDARWSERYIAFQDARAEALAHDGQTRATLAAVTETIEHLEQIEELWLLPELLRRKGELLLLQDASREAEAAENCFRQALDRAHRQGALSWQLRAAMSLARLLRDQGRPADATALLQPVYDRFTEGFHTADLQSARALLDSLQ